MRSFYSGTIQISLLRICKRPVSLPHRLIWSPSFINIYQISSWSFWFPTELVQIKSMRKLPSFLLIGKKLKVQISQVGFLFFFFLINPVFFLKTLLFNSSSIVFIFIVCTFEGKHEIPRHGHMCVCIYIYMSIFMCNYTYRYKQVSCRFDLRYRLSVGKNITPWKVYNSKGKIKYQNRNFLKPIRSLSYTQTQ